MEKRQLNLNAPLLSARRYSSPLKSSEIVTVQPSQWDSELLAPTGIPFQWEQSPGRPKDDTSRIRLDSFRRYRSGELPSAPPGGASMFTSGEIISDHKIYRPQVEAFVFNDHALLLEKLTESLKCDERNPSESGHDALSMPSSKELGAVNNRLRGAGDQRSYLKSSKSCSVESQTRDFMMERFLQAAKAAVIETPNYDVKKPLAVNGMPKATVKKTVSGQIAKTSIPFPYDHHLAENGESEDELESRKPVKRSGRVSWWPLPRFSVKNTLSLLNPLPARKPKKTTASVPKAISVGSFPRNTMSGPLDRSGSPAPEPPMRKFYSGLLSRDSTSQNSYKPELSQLRRYRSGSLSPYRNESPMSPFRDRVAFPGPPGELDISNTNKIASSRKIFNALHHSSSKNHRDERRSTSETVERTVYIDKSSYRKTTAAIKAPRFKYGSGDGFQDSDAKLSSAPTQVQKSIPTVRTEHVKSPLSPPLPNSPSESWLWKTLPSIPPPHQRLHDGHLQTKKQQPLRTRSVDPSWESLVKCSNVGNQHRRFSQEFVPRSAHRQSAS